MDWRRLCAALVSVAVIGIAACDDADPTTVSSATYLLRRDGVAGHCLTGEDGIYRPCDCAQTHTIEVIATLAYPAEAPYPGLEGAGRSSRGVHRAERYPVVGHRARAGGSQPEPTSPDPGGARVGDRRVPHAGAGCLPRRLTRCRAGWAESSGG